MSRSQLLWSLRKDKFAGESYIDTHCHIDLLFKRDGNFKGTFPEYMQKRKNSWAASYEGCIADFCFPETFMDDTIFWRSLLEEPGIYAAFGCHPHAVNVYNDDVEKLLMDRISNEKVVAVGEMGLDYSRKNKRDHQLQKNVFKSQLKLALDSKKPLLIHCRDAEDDCFKIMKEMVPHDYPIHRHCFTGDKDQALRLINYFPNLRIGLTTGIYDPRYEQLDLLKDFPLDRILIETDSPFFLPRFCRHDKAIGLEWNHPGIAFMVAAKLAEVRSLEVSDVLSSIRLNTREVYGI